MVLGCEDAKRGRVACGRVLLQAAEYLEQERRLRECLLAVELPRLSRRLHERLTQLDAPARVHKMQMRL